MTRLVLMQLSPRLSAFGFAICMTAALSTSACGASDPESPNAKSDGPLIVAVTAGGDAPASQVSGQLQLKDGCLVIGGHPIAWSTDATWDATSQTVRLGDEKVAVGSSINMGGGYYDQTMDWRAIVRDSAEAAIARCLKATGTSEFAVAY